MCTFANVYVCIIYVDVYVYTLYYIQRGIPSAKTADRNAAAWRHVFYRNICKAKGRKETRRHGNREGRNNYEKKTNMVLPMCMNI